MKQKEFALPYVEMELSSAKKHVMTGIEQMAMDVLTLA